MALGAFGREACTPPEVCFVEGDRRGIHVHASLSARTESR